MFFCLWITQNYRFYHWNFICFDPLHICDRAHEAQKHKFFMTISALSRTKYCFIVMKKKMRTRMNKGKLEMRAFCRTAQLDQKSHIRRQLHEKAPTKWLLAGKAIHKLITLHILIMLHSKISNICTLKCSGTNITVCSKYIVNPALSKRVRPIPADKKGPQISSDTTKTHIHPFFIVRLCLTFCINR